MSPLTEGNGDAFGAPATASAQRHRSRKAQNGGRGGGLLAALKNRGLALAVTVTLLAIAGISAAVLASRRPALSVRDRQWQQDVAYLARELPLVHVDGLTHVRRAAWEAAAARLEARIPRLTNGQVVVGMARLVAMLHDDETSLVLPPAAIYPVNLQWIGGGLYLIAVPAAERAALGARLVAVNGHPIVQVLARVRAVITTRIRASPERGRSGLITYPYNRPDT